MFDDTERKRLNYELHSFWSSLQKPRNNLKQGNGQEAPYETIYSFKNSTLAWYA